MQPFFPLISIDKDALDLIDDTSSFKKVSTLYLLKDGAATPTYYDGNGMLWKLVIKPKDFDPGFITKFLARTVYNPLVSVDATWAPAGTYKLEVLKTAIHQCIEADDDVITQFVPTAGLQEGLAKCEDFAGIVKMLRMYVFEPDEERLSEDFPIDDDV